MGWGFKQSWAIVVLYCPYSHFYLNVFSHAHAWNAQKVVSYYQNLFGMLCNILFWKFLQCILWHFICHYFCLYGRYNRNLAAQKWPYKVSPIPGLVPAFLLSTWKMYPIKSGHSRRRNSLGKTERPMSERKYSLEHITLSAITIFIYNSLLVFL